MPRWTQRQTPLFFGRESGGAFSGMMRRSGLGPGKGTDMATVHRQILLQSRIEAVWDALRDVGALHTRLVPGFVTNTVLEPDGKAREVTFANGMVMRELILEVNEELKRVVWSASGGRLTQHRATAQLFAESSQTRFVWDAEFEPAEAEPAIAQMIDAGLDALLRSFGAGN